MRPTGPQQCSAAPTPSFHARQLDGGGSALTLTLTLTLPLTLTSILTLTPHFAGSW